MTPCTLPKLGTRARTMNSVWHHSRSPTGPLRRQRLPCLRQGLQLQELLPCLRQGLQGRGPPHGTTSMSLKKHCHPLALPPTIPPPRPLGSPGPCQWTTPFPHLLLFLPLLPMSPLLPLLLSLLAHEPRPPGAGQLTTSWGCCKPMGCNIHHHHHHHHHQNHHKMLHGGGPRACWAEIGNSQRCCSHGHCRCQSSGLHPFIHERPCMCHQSTLNQTCLRKR